MYILAKRKMNPLLQSGVQKNKEANTMENILSVFTVLSVLIFWIPLFVTMLEWPTLLTGRKAPARAAVRSRPYGYTHCNCCRAGRLHRAA